MYFEFTSEEYMKLCEDYAGLCIQCGIDMSPIEPDARKVMCENCDAPTVYGIEELLLMGKITIIGE